MAFEEFTARAYTCDGCGKRKIVTDVHEMPNGIHGTATVVNAAGARTRKFYACTNRCLPTALNRGEEIGDVQPESPDPNPPANATPMVASDALAQPSGAVGIRNPDGSPALPIEP